MSKILLSMKHPDLDHTLAFYHSFLQSFLSIPPGISPILYNDIWGYSHFKLLDVNTNWIRSSLWPFSRLSLSKLFSMSAIVNSSLSTFSLNLLPISSFMDAACSSFTRSCSSLLFFPSRISNFLSLSSTISTELSSTMLILLMSLNLFWVWSRLTIGIGPILPASKSALLPWICCWILLQVDYFRKQNQLRKKYPSIYISM